MGISMLGFARMGSWYWSSGVEQLRVEQFLEEATVWRKLFVSANGLEASLKVKKDSLGFLPSYRRLWIQRAH